uniref:Uncharacterized protein n=2 Tax=Eutreptiella gymnastica TaxID=73025 RepID=A0A7S1I5P7_9EUGL|mmetsp:Transcript_132117/g.229026  ORF Transcript_132117/g.229026 Transcript_132117/m.229026 type:complete len:120 (+) Transcript_132117:393-752(+)
MALQQLRRAFNLTLDLHLCETQLGATGAQELVALLKGMTELHTLSLNLNGHNLGDRGVEALVDLLRSTSLHTVTLDLTFNGITEQGQRQLYTARDSGHFRSLRLFLGKNDFWVPPSECY